MYVFLYLCKEASLNQERHFSSHPYLSFTDPLSSLQSKSCLPVALHGVLLHLPQTVSFVCILRWTNVGHKLRCGCRWGLNPYQLLVRSSTWQPVLPGRFLGAPRTAACFGYPLPSGTVASSWFISCSLLKDAWATVQKVRMGKVFINKIVYASLASCSKVLVLQYTSWWPCESSVAPGKMQTM